MTGIVYVPLQLLGGGMDTEIKVSTECWPWRRKFSHCSCWDLNLWPFDHEFDVLTTELSPLPSPAEMTPLWLEIAYLSCRPPHCWSPVNFSNDTPLTWECLPELQDSHTAGVQLIFHAVSSPLWQTAHSEQSFLETTQCGIKDVQQLQ